MRTNDFISRKVIYKLKRQYGKPAGFYSYDSVVSDYETGKTVKTYDIYEINRVVILNNFIKRDFVYDLSYIAANKNFTYGGYFDTGERQILIDSKDVPVKIKEKDHLLVDDERYEIKHTYDYGNAYMIIAQYIDSDSPFESTMNTYTGNWSASVKAKLSVDELVRTIRNDIYSGGAFPTNNLLWLCSGNNLTESLKCVLHPSGIGTSLTNNNFISTDYKERGDDAGLDGNGSTKYLDLDYNPSVQLTFDDFHIAICGFSLGNSGDLFGCTGYRLTDGDFETEVTLDLGTLTKGCIIINSNANNSLKAYVDGSLVASNTTVRSASLPNLDLYLYASNGGLNIGDYRITALSIGNGLADAKVATLNTALNKYNTRLGRS